MEPFCHRSCVRKVPERSATTQQAGSNAPPTTRPHSKKAVRWRVLPSTFAHPKTNYHVPGGILTTTQAMTHKARGIAHYQIKTQSTTCVNAERNHWSMRQSRQATLVPSAFLSASSGTFNSLFKVLFIFPSWYLFAIGFEPIFSLR